MFLIDKIKLNIKKKFKPFFVFLHNCLGEESRERAKQNHFFSFHVKFAVSNKNIIQKKQEIKSFNISGSLLQSR